jgi:hypothetical protein
MTRALLQQALDALEKSKRSHTYCDDGWYSCPQAPDGCFDDSRGPECDCGADEFNAELDKTITAIRDHLDAPEQDADKQLAASQAREAALRKALEYIREHRLWINSHCKVVVETALKEAQS